VLALLLLLARSGLGSSCSSRALAAKHAVLAAVWQQACSSSRRR
jgi:hypothetical protein